MTSVFKYNCGLCTVLLTNDTVDFLLTKKWKYKVSFAHDTACAIDNDRDATEFNIDVSSEFIKVMSDVLMNPDNYENE